MQQSPGLREMIEQLVSTPSISSTLKQFDQSNLDVIHTLANWLQPLGFEITINPINGKSGKAMKATPLIPYPRMTIEPNTQWFDARAFTHMAVCPSEAS